jgi:hypothetical protein
MYTITNAKFNSARASVLAFGQEGGMHGYFGEPGNEPFED